MKRGREGDETVVHSGSFAEARAAEIRALSEELATRRSQRVMQSLPHHLQRRQMTFSARRLPLRLRATGERELAALPTAPKKPRHRAFRRRPRYLQEDTARRQREGAQWLATHQWHAKRFVMIRLFGFVLPKTPTDRGTRAAVRSALRQCAVHDASLERALLLSCPSEEGLAAALARLGRGWRSGPLRRGGRSGRLLLHAPDRPRETVAPVSFLWRPPAPERPAAQLLLWVHAAAAAEVRELLLAVLTQLPGSAVTEQVRGEKSCTRLTLSFPFLSRIWFCLS